MAKAKKATNKRRKVRKEKEEKLDPFFTRERIRRFFGFSFILAGIFLTVAFISYFFTWKADQDQVLDASWQLLFNKKLEISNHLGSLGALFSHLFFFDLFGIASFLAILLFGAWGANLVSGSKVFNASKITGHALFGIVWISMLCGLVLAGQPFSYAGGLGNLLAEWLTGVIGRIGMSIFVAFTGALYAWYFIIKPRSLHNLFTSGSNEKKPITDEDGFDLVESKALELSVDGKGAEKPGSPYTHHKDETFEVIEKEKEPFLINKETVAKPDAAINLDTKPVLNGKRDKKKKDEDLELAIEKVVEEKIEDKNKVSETSYDPTLDLASFKFPTLKLLEDHGDGHIQINKEELEQNKNQIIETLSNYNIKISKIKATVGPTVTLYEIVPAPGVRISKIKNLEDDIALSLAALGIRIIAPIPGKGTIGIEVPNEKKSIVSMKYMLASEKFRTSDMLLPIALGKTIANEIYITDLAKMPHLLMAGATGQGKSVGVNAIIISLLYKLHPSELKFVLVDPKKVELTLYKRLEKHYLAKLPGEEDAIITDTKKVIHTLNALCIEMDERYELLKNAHCRNIKEYNKKFKERKLNPQKGHRFLPYIVLVVDEFADLMMTAGKEVEMPIARLAQLARAIGIHLVIATQRPSVNIITGVIKANFPGRAAFKVTSKVDSRTILDAGGADQLIGRGDMLLSINGNITRLQCPFVDTPEVELVTDYIADQRGYEEAFLLPEYIDPKEDRGMADPLDDKDPMFEDAARVVVTHQQGSTSLIQRRLKLGYNRAGRIMDQLEAAGIVGPNAGSKAREVYIPDEYELERFLQQLEEGT
ncbi:MAG: DNA translocase FtsK [Bacteroidetes bacterium]|nr:DNA translocase FtsK [Bacteroidota bacterium]